MSPKVAVIEFGKNIEESFRKALQLIGGIDDLTTSQRSVVVKVGVFSHKAGNHSSVNVVNEIVKSFKIAPRIFFAESNNYRGTGTERLQLWRELFTERIQPFNLSEDSDTRRIEIAGIEMDLSHVLFKPNILVDTHIFRTYEKGSILKNLFGCTPDPEKAKFHKDTIFYPLLADIYEAVGGIDLAVLDGTYLWHGNLYEPMNLLVVGRDAVAVEAVGAHLAGLKPEKMRVIQEFVKRGLGTCNLKEIDIVGEPLEIIEEKCRSAVKRLKERWNEERKIQKMKGWSYLIDALIREGFFGHKRTRENVEEALESRGIATEGRSSVIHNTLTRRVKKGILKGMKGPEGWVFWTE